MKQFINVMMTKFIKIGLLRNNLRKSHPPFSIILILSVVIPAISYSAPPAPPTGLCLSPGELCIGDSTSTPSPTTVVATANVSTNNFHPGFYLSVGQSRNSAASAFGILANNPDFIGGKRIYNWKYLEPSENTYDFSSIEQDLKYLQSIGKQLWIQIGYTQYNGSLSPNTPSYMWKNSIYGCDPQYYGTYERASSAGGWIPCFWNQNVKTKLEALFTALGSRFNNEPYFEGISIDETAIDPNAAQTYSGYSANAVEMAFQEKALVLKKAFSNKVVMQHINFAPYNLEDFALWLANNGIGIGSPDVRLNNNGLTSIVYPQYLNYHNEVATGPDVQWDNYEAATSEELLLGAIELTNPWYMFWQRREPYFTDDVLPIVHTYKTLPAAQKYYDSVNNTQ